MKISEDEARERILANGYTIQRQNPRRIVVREQRGCKSSRTWTGVNFKDLALTFKLHEREAGK